MADNTPAATPEVLAPFMRAVDLLRERVNANATENAAGHDELYKDVAGLIRQVRDLACDVRNLQRDMRGVQDDISGLERRLR